MSPLRRAVRDERGMTMAEVLTAVAIITIGLVAVATGMQLGTAGVAHGQQETTATFLAEQRMEDVKAFALSTNAAQGFDNVTAANFGAEAYGAIATYNGYRRTTTITNPSATMKVVTVSVFFRPIGVSGTAAEREVALSTVLRDR
ncbi:MAG: prepilin-type N-terminal cleavage/methylation domain-containing protein [Candidatus Rokubacteria bacterium]|nr:prepilin-type N-terminal cleavage/methylation domain-containing protein [Candidatus Rokubacteria bacterium]